VDEQLNVLTECKVRYICNSYYIVMYELCKAQFNSLRISVDVYCLMMAL
jgi:hypothetical protein